MDRLIKIIQNYSEEESILPQSNFRKDLGIASFDTVCMTAEINKTLGINIDASDFLKYRTVEELWAYIRQL